MVFDWRKRERLITPLQTKAVNIIALQPQPNIVSIAHLLPRIEINKFGKVSTEETQRHHLAINNQKVRAQTVKATVLESWMLKPVEAHLFGGVYVQTATSGYGEWAKRLEQSYSIHWSRIECNTYWKRNLSNFRTAEGVKNQTETSGSGTSTPRKSTKFKEVTTS